MHKLIGVLVMSGALVACGGGGGGSGGGDPEVDYSPSFAGTWVGTLTITANGQAESVPGTFARIVRTDVNALQVQELCQDGSGPNATVTGPGSFTAVGITCPPAPVSGCSSTVLAYDRGSTGSLVNGTLTLSGTGSFSGCSVSLPWTFSFVATKSTSGASAQQDEGQDQTQPRLENVLLASFADSVVGLRR